MMKRLMRFVVLLFWLELGLALIVVPWLDLWDTNYFLFQYPALALVLKNPFLRGAISGLGVINVMLSIEAFRHRTTTVASRPSTTGTFPGNRPDVSSLCESRCDPAGEYFRSDRSGRGLGATARKRH